jgi:hypothetical protein
MKIFLWVVAVAAVLMLLGCEGEAPWGCEDWDCCFLHYETCNDICDSTYPIVGAAGRNDCFLDCDDTVYECYDIVGD